MDYRREIGRHLLVIDDSPSCRAVVREFLKDLAFEIDEATETHDGLLKARILNPELILIDPAMGQNSGFETLRRLKEDSRTRSIAVILVSATNDPTTKAKGLDLGAVDFMTKPLEKIELQARVRAALRSKRHQDLLERRAHLDALTGLGNRLAFGDRLAADWSSCRRRGESLSLLIADLDRFKTINDRFGHPAGDAILIEAAHAFRDSLRACDFLARFGGEEFVAIAPNCGLEGALTLADRFRKAVALIRSVPSGDPLTVTTSVGVATLEDLGLLDSESLLRRADEALYRAKNAGRDRVCAWGLGCDQAHPLFDPITRGEGHRVAE